MPLPHLFRLPYRVKRWCHRAGIHVGRTHPDLSVGLFLEALFAAYQINCVLDVGAHHGEYGQVLRHHGYTGRIISFEPVSASFAVLEHQCAADAAWEAYPWALGAEDGSAVITVPASSEWASFRAVAEVTRQAVPGQVQLHHTETVQVYRLDSIFDTVTASIPAPRVYLKLDIQGWDLHVLRGAAGSLARVAALQAEMAVLPLYEGAPTYLEALTTLSALGFAPAAFFPVNRTAELKLAEFDCVMVRATQPTAPLRLQSADMTRYGW